MANAQKVFSIFEPHTDLIKRGKILKDIEFGHKVFLAESACGLITQYRVLDGNPSDQDQVEACAGPPSEDVPALSRTVAAWTAVSSAKRMLRFAGVRESRSSVFPSAVVRRTSNGKRSRTSPVFKKGQRFRAGIEGRISVLFRGRGMKRCLAEGRDRFELLVGAAVLANNLMVIAQLLIQKQKRRRQRRNPLPRSETVTRHSWAYVSSCSSTACST